MQPEPMRDIESDGDVHRRAGRPEQRDGDRKRHVGDLFADADRVRGVSIAGSEASDERVEIATACGPIIASLNAPRPIAPADERQRVGRQA